MVWIFFFNFSNLKKGEGRAGSVAQWYNVCLATKASSSLKILGFNPQHHIKKKDNSYRTHR
jgi:hypothetical protein